MSVTTLRLVMGDGVQWAEATECVFYYYIKVYNTMVKNATLSQSVASTWYDPSPVSIPNGGLVFSPPRGSWPS